MQGALLKKLVEAIKDLITDGNFVCSAEGITLQAMDTSHVCLVSFLLRSDGFEHYRSGCRQECGIPVTACAFAQARGAFSNQSQHASVVMTGRLLDAYSSIPCHKL